MRQPEIRLMNTAKCDKNTFDDMADRFFQRYGADETMNMLASWMAAICSSHGQESATVEISNSVLEATVAVDLRRKEKNLDRYDFLSRFSPSLN